LLATLSAVAVVATVVGVFALLMNGNVAWGVSRLCTAGNVNNPAALYINGCGAVVPKVTITPGAKIAALVFWANPEIGLKIGSTLAASALGIVCTAVTMKRTHHTLIR
jgi:hypothetical protein